MPSDSISMLSCISTTTTYRKESRKASSDFSKEIRTFSLFWLSLISNNSVQINMPHMTRSFKSEVSSHSSAGDCHISIVNPTHVVDDVDRNDLTISQSKKPNLRHGRPPSFVAFATRYQLPLSDIHRFEFASQCVPSVERC